MRRGIIFVSEKIKLTFLFRDAAIDEGAAAMSWTLLQLDSCCRKHAFIFDNCRS